MESISICYGSSCEIKTLMLGLSELRSENNRKTNQLLFSSPALTDEPTVSTTWIIQTPIIWAVFLDILCIYSSRSSVLPLLLQTLVIPSDCIWISRTRNIWISSKRLRDVFERLWTLTADTEEQKEENGYVWGRDGRRAWDWRETTVLPRGRCLQLQSL